MFTLILVLGVGVGWLIGDRHGRRVGAEEEVGGIVLSDGDMVVSHGESKLGLVNGMVEIKVGEK